MGFFGWVCSGVSSVVRGVATGIREVASAAWKGVKAVVSTVAKVGPTVLAVAKPLVQALCIVAPQLGVPLGKVITIAETVVRIACVACGIMDSGESVRELGERALEAGEQGIHPEDFADPEEYLNTVRKTPLAEDRDKWTEEQRSLSGISTLAYCLQVKFHIPPEIYPLFVRYHKFFTERRVDAYIKYAVDTGYDLNKINDYFSSNATMAEKDAALAVMKTVEETLSPNFDKEKFAEELLETKLERHEGAI